MGRIRQQGDCEVEVIEDRLRNRSLIQRRETSNELADRRLNNSPVQKTLIIQKCYTFNYIKLVKLLNK